MSDPLDGFYVAIDNYIRRAVAPLRQTIEAQATRIAELESRGTLILHGVDGKDGAPGERGAEGPAGRDGKDGAPGRDGIDGRSVDPAEVEALVSRYVAAAVAAIPAPKDGKDGRDGFDGKDGAPGPQGPAGARGEPGAMGETGPAGERGERGEKGLDGAPGRDGLDGAAGKDGRDGVSILSALVDGDGELVLTMSDGATRKAGVVRGRDGRDGIDGRAGDVGAPGRDAVAVRPIPLIEDGKAYPAGTWAAHAGGSWYAEKATEPLEGRAPQDAGWMPLAIGEQAMSISMADDGRTVVVRRVLSTGATLEKQLTMPVVLDRGVYAAGKAYARGDGVTRAGSYWIAKVDNPRGVPGQASDDWRLAVKAGRDGKDSA